MFGTIRRHQTWLWSIIITLTIISFVIFLDPSERAGRSRSGGGGNAPKINGRTITGTMLAEAEREVRFIYFLNNRRWPEQDPERAKQIDWQNEAFLRLFRFGKAEEMGIHVSDAALAESARRFLGDMPLDKFVKEVLAEHGLNENDVERFLLHQTMDQQLISLVGAPGRMILPAEAEVLYRRDHQETAGDIVFFHTSNYLSKVVITNGALTNWYGLRAAEYRIPDKVRVSYIEFAKSNFLAEAEKDQGAISNLNMRLQEHYFKMGGTNHYKDTNGVPLSEEKAIAQIKEDDINQRAFRAAVSKAYGLATKLYDKQHDPQQARPDNLETLAKEEGLSVHVSEPFDREGPTNMYMTAKMAEDFAQEAFKLDATNNPISFQPLAGTNGVYLIALKELLPGRPQAFEEVRAKVEEDYKRFNALTLARSEATNFIARTTNGMAQGKTFDEMVLQYNATQQAQLKSETLPPISLSTESLTNLEERVNIETLKRVIFSVEPGRVSGYMDPRFAGSPDGFVVHVRAKLPLDEAKLREELPKFLEELRYQKQNEIFGQWFRKQVEKEQWLKELLEKGQKARQQRPS